MPTDFIDYIGDILTPTSTFTDALPAPDDPEHISFALLDRDGEELPNSRGVGVPAPDQVNAYDLGPVGYRGEYWGYRVWDTGYSVLAERFLDRKKRKSVMTRRKFVSAPHNVTRIKLP